ncbi:hypothetical protein pb186bvf_014998 [Paramecium bursaria]
MKKREAKLLAKQQVKEDDLSQLQAVSPQREDYDQRQIEFKQFYKTQFKLAQEKYPKRSQAELSKFVNLLWKVEKQNSQIYQENGKVLINGEFVDVPQQPISAYAMFIKKMKDQIKIKHPEYDPQQMTTALSILWNAQGEEVNEIKQEQQKLNEVLFQSLKNRNIRKRNKSLLILTSFGLKKIYRKKKKFKSKMSSKK